METRNDVTIYDIAKALNLSASTISRALNGTGAVDKQTLSRVARTADELGYRRNYFASRLRSRRSQLLGAMVTQLNTTISSCVLAGAEAVSSELGYCIVLSQSMNRPELRTQNLDNLRKHSVDGLLITSAYFQENSLLEQLAKTNIPRVVFEASSLLPGHPKKQVSDFQNAYELTSHLIEKGCKRIAYLSINVIATQQAALFSGYSKALLDNDLVEADRFVLNGQNTNDSWLDVCEMLLSMKSKPDGIIFSNSSITALAFCPSGNLNSKGNEIWITCRKGSMANQSKRLIELGKFAATLLICLSQMNSNGAAGESV